MLILQAEKYLAEPYCCNSLSRASFVVYQNSVTGWNKSYSPVTAAWESKAEAESMQMPFKVAFSP